MNKTLLLILLLGMPAAFCTGVYAREFRVAISGFESRSDEDISFIQSALRSLLPSRISEPHRIAVIDPEQKARADFLLSGFIRKQGNTISLDAQLVHLARNSRQEPVGVFTTTPDKLIPELNLFARKVRQVITRYPQPPDPAGRQARRVPPRQQRTIENEIPEDMPYPPMPEKKFSDRLPAQQVEEERVSESALDDTAP